MQREYDGPVDPFTCPHYTGKHVGHHLLCDKDGRKVWVDCRTGQFGELPRCRMVEPDNSPEAMVRRVEWAKASK